MIQVFVDRFMERKAKLRELLSKRPDSYKAILEILVDVVSDGEDGSYGEELDKSRIHEIDDGDYQGTLVFVIGACGYQPSAYWYTRVSYGSCSGCDTLQAVRGWDDEISKDEIDGYETLALHMLQAMKRMGDDSLA